MKKDKSHREDQERIDQEAADWILRMDRGLTSNEQDEYTDWLSADQRHKDAFNRSRWGWEEIDRLAGLQMTHGLEINPDLLEEDAPSNKVIPMVLSFLNLSIPIAAALVIAAIVLFRSVSDTDSINLEKNEVVVERIERMVLDDGSIVELNHGAEVLVDYKPNKRYIYLLKGEANFDVEKDPNRPFVVSASGFEFEALGTEFVVRHRDNQMDLIVSEGKVRFTPKSQFQNDAYDETFDENTIVVSSQKAVIDLDPHETAVDLHELSENEIRMELFWKPELFEFQDEPLENIVNAFNSKNSVQIYFADDSIKELSLSSLFWSDNVEAFIRLLVSNFGLNVQYADESQIILGKANS